MKRILAFSGSNSSTSINQQLVRAVSALESDLTIDVIDLRDFPAPIFGVDLEANEGVPESMVTLRNLMSEYDGYIISSPEHNGSIPTFFKNTLDWLSRQGGKIFQEKSVVFLAASPGARGGASVLQHLLEVMPHRGAKIVGGHGVGMFPEKMNGDNLKEGEDKMKIQELLYKLSAQI
jgi:NAD(P)H-dependent FMN reductase